MSTNDIKQTSAAKATTAASDAPGTTTTTTTTCKGNTTTTTTTAGCSSSTTNTSSAPSTTVTPVSAAELSLGEMLAVGLRRACLLNDGPEVDRHGPHACYISLRTIPVLDYIKRFNKYAQCTEECYAIAAVLLDRWCAVTGVQLHRSIVHKLLLCSLLAALKMH
eukprot:PhM_4_TR388/c5_g2_i1/m.106733